MSRRNLARTPVILIVNLGFPAPASALDPYTEYVIKFLGAKFIEGVWSEGCGAFGYGSFGVIGAVLGICAGLLD